MGGLRVGALEVMAEQVTGRGTRGVVAAAAPLAAALGAEVMRAGGNAYDAVVVAALAETVLLPPKCGLGGDLVVLRLAAGAVEPEALIAIGPAAAGLAAAIEEAGGLPQTGGLSVGVPAACAGYAALAADASLPLAELAQPAIDLAVQGFPWATICTHLTDVSAALLREHQPDGCPYLPHDRSPEPGEIVSLPGLARALAELAERGAGALDGPLGAAIVERVSAAGGVITSDDLAAARAEWVPAARVDLGGSSIWATPAPTHGPALLDTMATVADLDQPAALWRAFQAATARRRARLGDNADGGTSMVSAVDAAGDVVVVIHSNSFPQYGSGLVVPEYDLVLNNRAGRGFVAETGHPNAPVAGHRPATTLHAWAYGPTGERPTLLGGTPGGANQVSWNAQMLSEVVAGQADPGVLVASPRWEWLPDGDGVVVEDGLPAAEVAALEAAAPGALTSTGMWGLRCAQQVVRVPTEGDAVVAAVDPRTGGAAVAV